MHLRRGIEIDLAGDTREAPEVLVLEVGTVAPTHHLHGDEVAARLEVLRDVELSSDLCILGVTDIASVDPQEEVAGGRAYVEEHLLSFPVGRQVEGAAVRTGIVVGLTDIGGIVLKGGAPSIAHVLIGLVAVAVDLEESWHGEIHPLGVVVLQGIEVLRRILVVLDEAELPRAFHRKIAGRSALVATGLVAVLEGKEVGASRFTVHLIHTGVFPDGCLVGSKHRQSHETSN